MLQGGLTPPFAPFRELGAGLVLLRFATKDPPARLCRVSVGVLEIPRYLSVYVLYLICGCRAPHPPAPGLPASGVLAALGAGGGRPGAAPPGAGGLVRNVLGCELPCVMKKQRTVLGIRLNNSRATCGRGGRRGRVAGGRAPGAKHIPP